VVLFLEYFFLGAIVFLFGGLLLLFLLALRWLWLFLLYWLFWELLVLNLVFSDVLGLLVELQPNDCLDLAENCLDAKELIHEPEF